MEEGPEPHEWVERSVEHHHQEHEHASEGADRHHLLLPAITAAVLAVLAALGSLLSGHAASQAILKQSQATDQWAYYQAKSTKGHLYEVGQEIVQALARPETGSKPTEEVLAGFRRQVAKYEKDKEEIKKQAEELEADSRHEFQQHHWFALGIVAFQVGIVLASISILVRYRVLYGLSLVAGLAGFVFSLVGFVS